MPLEKSLNSQNVAVTKLNSRYLWTGIFRVDFERSGRTKWKWHDDSFVFRGSKDPFVISVDTNRVGPEQKFVNVS